MTKEIIFEKVRSVPTPIYSSDGAAALDFFIPTDLGWECSTLSPGQTIKISSGIKIQLPGNVCLIGLNKSGLGLKGLNCSCPLIDPDYRGEIHLVVTNVSNKDVIIRKGEKLIQFLATEFFKLKLNEGIIKTDTERGAQGFGSTGLSA